MFLASGVWSESGLSKSHNYNTAYSYFPDLPKTVQLFTDPREFSMPPNSCTNWNCEVQCGETCETCEGSTASCMTCPAGKVLNFDTCADQCSGKFSAGFVCSYCLTDPISETNVAHRFEMILSCSLTTA